MAESEEKLVSESGRGIGSNRSKNSEFPRTEPMMSSNSGGPITSDPLNGPQLNRREYQRLQRVPGTRPMNTPAVKRHRRLYVDSHKVIAFLCGLFACILLIMALASSEWLVSSGYKQGLFVYCVTSSPNGTLPRVPFEEDIERMEIGCYRLDLSKQAYTLVAATFCFGSLLVNIFATLLTILGLRCRDINKKYKYYLFAVIVMAIALVAVLVTLIVYPVCFSQIINKSDRIYWEFGWAYGVGWGAAIFLFGGIILLLCDKESEEIYYKERTIVQYADSAKN